VSSSSARRSSWFCRCTSRIGGSGGCAASSLASVRKRSQVNGGSAGGKGLPSSTSVPAGDESMWNVAIKRRAPRMPSPMPVSDGEALRPSSTAARSAMPGPWSRTRTEKVAGGSPSTKIVTVPPPA